MKKLRLTTIITGMTYGGAQRILIDLHQVMPDFVQPEVIGLYPGGMAKFLREQNVPVTEFNFVGNVGTMRSIPALARHLKRTRPHLVMTHLNKADVVGRIAARLAGVPLVLSVCHNMELWKENRLLNTADNLTAKLADGILTISKAAKNLQIEYGMSGDKIRVSHGRAELRDRFDTIGIPNEKAAAYRKEFGLSDDTIVSIMVGRFYPQKAHEVGLRALKLLQKKDLARPHVLLMAGDGPLKDKMESYAKKLLPPEAYRFLGNRDDIVDLLGFADLFVMPSRWEGTPLALQESFAAGLPAVLTDIPSMSEVVDDCQGALIFPVEDHRAMAKQWFRMITDDKLRAQLAKQGRENALAHWDIRNLRDEYFKFIAELAVKNPKLKKLGLPKELLDYRSVETFCQ